MPRFPALSRAAFAAALALVSSAGASPDRKRGAPPATAREAAEILRTQTDGVEYLTAEGKERTSLTFSDDGCTLVYRVALTGEDGKQRQTSVTLRLREDQIQGRLPKKNPSGPQETHDVLLFARGGFRVDGVGPGPGDWKAAGSLLLRYADAKAAYQAWKALNAARIICTTPKPGGR